MPTKKPRAGSLQIWPRKRARKFLPSVNWRMLPGENGLLGLVVYKVGMRSIEVKDNTADSMTKGKKIVVPATVLEIPGMKIYSARLYKNNLCIGEIVLSDDKELKRILKTGKKGSAEDLEKRKDEFDDLRVIVYSLASKTGLKKTPDIAEVGLGGSIGEKIAFVKEKAGKEIPATELVKKLELVDIRGLSQGKGLEGPVKRFGISLKGHKTEKGVRRPGSLGPWHPHHVTFRVAQAGQLGMQTRNALNLKVVEVGKISEKDINPSEGWMHYGKIRTEYALVRGSVPGPSKRQLLMTRAFRKTKYSDKKNYEFVRILE